MSTRSTGRQRLLMIATSAAVLALAAPRVGADDLPPPQVRAGGSTRTARTDAWRIPTRRPAPTTQALRPSSGQRPRALPSGVPSEPLALRGRERHSTYVPPLRADSARPPAARTRPVAGRGRVPVTTFRVAPAPRPRPLAKRPAPSPRATTWNPRPVSTPPAARLTRPPAALPTPSVRQASPSYEEIQRTRAHAVTSRPRPEASATHLRTLQRRGSATTVRRRAVRPTDLSVPMAPGQSAPQPPTRRTLPLRPPPGCSGGT